MDAATLSNVLSLLQIGVILLGGFYFLWKMETKLSILTVTYSAVTTRLDKVDIKLDGLTAITIQIAKQEERMNAQDQRVQELSMRLDTIRYLKDSNNGGNKQQELLPPRRGKG